ncbi:MAG: hypothetical protein Q8K58_15740 [Acidimicrobiales bacterium]|nr:hypothetical protein [Acidimicrobiales bacterium]
MVVSVRVEAPDGRLEVVQRADAADRDALRHEAGRLQAAAHPGVVAVLGSAPWGDGWELRLDHGGVPMGATQRCSPARLARLVAGAAGTLADLHDRGIVHGRLDAWRVLVGSTGEPVLCAFGAADAAGQAPDDVAALGRILLEALDRAPDPSGLALRAVAERALAEPPSRRPPARRLARDLSALAGAAPAPRTLVPPPPRPTRWRSPLLVGLSALILLAGLAGVRRSPPARGHQAAAAPSSPATTLPEPPPCIALDGAPAGPPDCPLDIRVEKHVATVDGRRHVLGARGDLVAVGDWDCDGEPTAATLRPATGEVLVFARFEPDADVRVTLAQRMPEAVDFAIGTDPHGCAELAVQDTSGGRTEVGLAADPGHPAALPRPSAAGRRSQPRV